MHVRCAAEARAEGRPLEPPTQWRTKPTSSRSRDDPAMTLKIQCVTVDARDPDTLAAWWAEALGYTVLGPVTDGVEALNLARRKLPDLVETVASMKRA